MSLIACQASAPPPTSPTVVPIRSISVVVVTTSGSFVGGASVCAVTVAERQERCGETAANGRARLDVRAGSYLVRVTPPSGTRLGPGQSWADAIDANETTFVELEPRSKISGTVRDVDGAAVADAQICAHPPSSESPKCARSNAQGAYTVEVRSDVYKLDVTGPPGGKLIPQWARGRLVSDEADPVDVRTADAQGIDVDLQRGVALSGIIRGPSGPIEDAQICMRSLEAPLPWDCERTNRNGRYVALREPGRYYIWVIPPDNVRLMTQWYDNAPDGIRSSAFFLGDDSSLDVTLEPGPQIRGRVRTTDGAPVLFALVCADTRFPTGRICRPTDDEGFYSITTRPESYVVQVFPPSRSTLGDLISEYWFRKRTWFDADLVRLGDDDRTLDLTVRKGVKVTGVIRDKRGLPLEAATVNILDGAGPLVGGDTDASGTYSIVVPPGDYQIEVFAPFRGERGDLLSQPPRDLVVDGFTRYDVVLEDANP